MLRDLLRAEDLKIGRLHVSTLMKKMAIEAIYRRPNTSKAAAGNRIYPYLLRKLPIVRPNQVWATDITHVPTARGWRAGSDWVAHHWHSDICHDGGSGQSRRDHDPGFRRLGSH